MNFWVINGSATRDGNTSIMVREFKKMIESRENKVTIYNLIDGSEILTGQIDKTDDVDVLVFASPIYWGGMTGLLKQFIDLLNPNLPFFKNLKYGVALVNSEYSNGFELTLTHFQLIFKHIGVEYLESLIITGMQNTGDMNMKLYEVDSFARDLMKKITKNY